MESKKIKFNSNQQDISKGEAFELWKAKPLNKKEFKQLNPNEKLKYLCIMGGLAPTTHNTVPQRFKINPKGKTIQVLLNKKRILKQSDPTGRQALISMGCSIQNILSTIRGYNLNYNLNLENTINLDTKEKDFLEKIATIELLNKDENIQEGSKIVEKIIERKVCRAEYDSKVDLPDKLVKKSIELENKYKNINLHLIQDKIKINKIAKLQEDADRSVFEDKDFTNELGNWIRLNTDSKSPTGIRGRELGLSTKFTKEFKKGLQGKKRLLPDQIAMFAKGSKAGMESSSAIGIITAKDNTFKNQIKVGMLYQEIALLLRKFNFVDSIHAGTTEVDWVKKILTSTILKTKEEHMLLFRIGVPKDKKDLQRSHSSRPPLKKLIINI